MADTKISALTELTALAGDDRLVVVDISDTSMAASGTDKFILSQNVTSVPRTAHTSNFDVFGLSKCYDITALSVTATIKDVASGGPDSPAAGGWFEVRCSVASGTIAATGSALIRDPTTGATTTSVTLAQYETVRFYESGDNTWVMVWRLDPDLQAIGKLTSAANSIPYWTGAGTAAILLRDTDVTLAANADTSLATQKATKAYIDARITRTLFSYITDVGNITTGEDDLYTDTIASATLTANSQQIKANYGGITVAHATATRQIRAYFAGTKIMETPANATATANNWWVEVNLIRVSNTVVRYNAVCLRGVTTAQGVVFAVGAGEITGLNLTTTGYILKITGEAAAAGAATNDVVAKSGSVIFQPA